MHLSDLMRRLRRRGISLAELAALSIAAGLTAALIVNAITDSRHYGLWVGSAVTVGMSSILIRIRRDS
jgi:lambda repressor-like predicted transcriptional regulator